MASVARVRETRKIERGQRVAVTMARLTGFHPVAIPGINTPSPPPSPPLRARALSQCPSVDRETRRPGGCADQLVDDRNVIICGAEMDDATTTPPAPPRSPLLRSSLAASVSYPGTRPLAT